MANTKRRSRVFTVSFPEDLAQQVDQFARQDGRSVSELFREAFRTYRMEKIRKHMDEDLEYSRQRNTHGYTPDDVERLVHEVRAERERERKRR
jgi:metal-responsive CopG/Arc/MetJ family transcriptional regulator